MGNREDKLKGILKRIQQVEPPHDFTAEVMREIEAMTEEKVYADEKIKRLLQSSSTPAPSNAFTYKVLNAIRETTSVKRGPIISKSVWAGILSFITLCIVITITSGTGGSSSEKLYVMSFGDYLSNFFGRYSEIILYAAIALTSGSLLLLLDHLLNRSARLSK